MVVSVLVHQVVPAGAVALTAWILPGISIEGGVVAVSMGIVNALVPSIAEHLPRPKYVVLLALLTLAVNAALIRAVAALTDVLTVSGLLDAAVLIPVFSTVLVMVAVRLRAPRRKQIARNAQGPRSSR